MTTLPMWDGMRWVRERADAEFSRQHDTLMEEPTHFAGFAPRRRTITGRVVRHARAFATEQAGRYTVLVMGRGRSDVWQRYVKIDTPWSPRLAERRALAEAGAT